MTKLNILLGIPIYNEESFISNTFKGLTPLLESYPTLNILMYDDGSTDSTPAIIDHLRSEWKERIIYVKHKKSMGYGKTIIDILKYGCEKKDSYDVVITFDADMQHDPASVPEILEKMEQENHVDIVSTSRYLDPEKVYLANNVPFDRFLVNMNLTKLTNTLYNFNITDSFCGLKGYRVCRVERMFTLRDVGYSSPIEFWINCAYHDFFIEETPTSLLYVDERRGRGGWEDRLESYINSFYQYAWADDQRAYIQKMKPKIIEFIQNKLNEYECSGEDRAPVLSFSEFWNKNQEESPFTKFTPKNVLNQFEVE